MIEFPWNHPLSSSWRKRLITWFFAPAMLILAGVAVLNFLAYDQVTSDMVVERNREVTSLSAARLREELTNFSDVLESLAREVGLSQGQPQLQRQALAGAGRRLTVFDGGVVLLDRFGRVSATQPERPEIMGHDWSYRPYFRDMVGSSRVVFSYAVKDGPGETHVVAMAVPVNGPKGEYLGVLAGLFRVDAPPVSALYASIVRLRIGQSGRLYLADSNGRIIYHSEPEHIGEGLAGRAEVDEALVGRAGAIRTQDFEGREIVAAYSPVPGTPWALVTEEDWDALTLSSRSYGQSLLLLLVIGTLLPAAGMGLFARQRRIEAVEQERLAQELSVARSIQETLLPTALPDIAGWKMAVHWQPARAVGGDFYDFIPLPEGRLGLVIGDVSGKGVPSALMMASVRAVLRATAEQLQSPGQVLARANAVLRHDMPRGMFVTCLYAVLDPRTGRMRYANAGHNPPYRRHAAGGSVSELKARGMPLGIMPDAPYEELEAVIAPDDAVLLYSDGLVEARKSRREIFGFERVRALSQSCTGDEKELIECLLKGLASFTGKGWVQDDDITVLALRRLPCAPPDSPRIVPMTTQSKPLTTGNGTIAETASASPSASAMDGSGECCDWEALADFELPSEVGNEREAMRRVAEAVQPLNLPPERIERLKTAVAEATLNAIEHGNRYQADLPVAIRIVKSKSDEALAVSVTDYGTSGPLPERVEPDLDAKLAGRQSPRGWGFFLIEKMVDGVRVTSDDAHHTIELFLYTEGRPGPC